jgi:hypothetical protein
MTSRRRHAAALFPISTVPEVKTAVCSGMGSLVDAARTASLDDDEDEGCRRHGGADLDEDDQQGAGVISSALPCLYSSSCVLL